MDLQENYGLLQKRIEIYSSLNLQTTKNFFGAVRILTEYNYI
jgi:hypothetical protein